MVTLLLKANGEHKLIVNKLFPVEEELMRFSWYEDIDKPVEILASFLDKSERMV